MSPVLVRPVREQFEHDRVIRVLQARLRRKFEVGANPGHEQNVAVGSGPTPMHPDLVLTALDGGRRLEGVIEVETVESVNHLEALSQWARFAKLRAPFHLYVPTAVVDLARRLCADYRISTAELVSYHTVGDQLRFTTVDRRPAPTRRAPRPSAGPASGRNRTATRRAAASRPAGSKRQAAATGSGRKVGAKRSAVATRKKSVAPSRRASKTRKAARARQVVARTASKGASRKTTARKVARKGAKRVPTPAKRASTSTKRQTRRATRKK